MALKAAIKLDLLEIMARAGPGAHLSTAQMASQLPTHNPDAPAMLDRILGLLASYSILTCSLVTGEDGRIERLYGLTPVCKFLTKNEDGFSIAPLLVMNHDKVFMETWNSISLSFGGPQPQKADQPEEEDKRSGILFCKTRSQLGLFNRHLPFIAEEDRSRHITADFSSPSSSPCQSGRRPIVATENNNRIRHSAYCRCWKEEEE